MSSGLHVASPLAKSRLRAQRFMAHPRQRFRCLRVCAWALLFASLYLVLGSLTSSGGLSPGGPREDIVGNSLRLCQPPRECRFRRLRSHELFTFNPSDDHSREALGSHPKTVGMMNGTRQCSAFRDVNPARNYSCSFTNVAKGSAHLGGEFAARRRAFPKPARGPPRINSEHPFDLYDVYMNLAVPIRACTPPHHRPEYPCVYIFELTDDVDEGFFREVRVEDIQLGDAFSNVMTWGVRLVTVAARSSTFEALVGAVRIAPTVTLIPHAVANAPGNIWHGWVHMGRGIAMLERYSFIPPLASRIAASCPKPVPAPVIKTFFMVFLPQRRLTIQSSAYVLSRGK